jgi:hypothetical protein
VSIALMTVVWKLDLPPSDKMVLLALADAANDDGVTWMAVKSKSAAKLDLLKKCSLSLRAVQGALKRLCEGGHLAREDRIGKGVIWTVTPAADAPRQDMRPAANASTPAADAPKPSSNRQFVEANASTSPPKRSVAVRGTRIPDDWTPSPDCQSFAQTEGLTQQETAREAASFRDYWIGRSGREAIKLDWPATWRNWIRRCDVGKRGKVQAGGSGPRRNGSQPVSMAGILAERRRQAEGANDVSDIGGVFRAC